jgi:uncharacterized delta-60 repeat protein
LDPEFDGGAGGNGEVLSLALAGEGKIYVGGSFSEFNGWRSPGLVRLNANGSRDTNYAAANLQDPPLRERQVRGLTVQPDGGVIVTGDFQDWNGVRAPSITRLNAEGQMDVEFTENLRPIFGGTTIGTMFDTAVLSDGRVIVSGVVSAVLEADGRPTADLSDDPLSAWTMLPNDELVKAHGDRKELTVRRYRVTAGEEWEKLWEVVHPCNGVVTAVAMQADGAILVGGCFTVLGGQRHQGLARLKPDGSLDPAFNMDLGDPWPSTLQVTAWGLQSDGRLVLNVSSYRSVTGPFPNLIRVKSDGSLDPTFTPVQSFTSIRSMVLGPSDQIVVAAYFDEPLTAFNAHDERVLESPSWREGQFEATIRTRPGRRYFMEATGDPAASTWVEVGSVDGDGTAKPFSVSSVDRRFYRMRITDR